MNERSWTLHIPASATAAGSGLPSLPFATLFLTTGASALAGVLYSASLANATRLDPFPHSKDLSFSVSLNSQPVIPDRLNAPLLGLGRVANVTGYAASPAGPTTRGRESNPVQVIVAQRPMPELYRPQFASARETLAVAPPRTQVADPKVGMAADLAMASAVTGNDSLPAAELQGLADVRAASLPASEPTVGKLATDILSRGNLGFLQETAGLSGEVAQSSARDDNPRVAYNATLGRAGEAVTALAAGKDASFQTAELTGAGVESPAAMASPAATVEQLVTDVLARGNIGFLQVTGVSFWVAPPGIGEQTVPDRNEIATAETTGVSASNESDLRPALQATPPEPKVTSIDSTVLSMAPNETASPATDRALNMAPNDAASPATPKALSMAPKDAASPATDRALSMLPEVPLEGRHPALASSATAEHPSGIPATEGMVVRVDEPSNAPEFFVPTRLNRAVAGSVALRVDLQEGSGSWQGFSVRVADVLDLLRTKMPRSEYLRLRASSSADEFVTFERLRSAGLAMRFDDRAQLELTVA